MAGVRFGWREAARLGLWGAATVVAASAAVLAATTDGGRERLGQAFADLRETVLPSGVERPRALSQAEIFAVLGTVRALSSDRERLLSRIDALESDVRAASMAAARAERTATEARTAAAQPPLDEPARPRAAPASPPYRASQDEITGSISSSSAPPPTAPPSPATPTGNQVAATEPAPPPEAAPPPAPRPEFGIDLGTAASAEALKNAWTLAQRRHGKLLDGLKAGAVAKERPGASTPIYHLVAGPIPSAAAAARLCAQLTAAGAICSPTVFDGQRLAGR